MEIIVPREIFFNISSTGRAIFYIVATIAVASFIFGVYHWVKILKKGMSFLPTAFVIRGIVKIVSNKTILKDNAFVGIAHFLVFWGFVVLTIGTATIALNFDILMIIKPTLNIWKGLFYKIFSIFMEIFGISLILGIILLMIRRLFFRTTALDYKRPDYPKTAYSRLSYITGDWVFLLSIFTIAVSGFALEGSRIALVSEPIEQFSFVGYVLAPIFKPFGNLTYMIIWWFHSLLSLTFIAYIPFSKAMHIITDTVILLLTRIDKGKIPYTSEEAELELDEIGKLKYQDLTTYEILQLEACTKCGRCHNVCPARIANLPLSPREVILDSREYLRKNEKYLLFSDNQIWEEDLSDRDKLIGGMISKETLWSCTTCLACSEVCPVEINHLHFIAKMRLHLIEEGDVDEGIQEALENIAEEGNSFGEDADSRGEWTSELNFVIKNGNTDTAPLLWFVGDFASFDARAIKVSRDFARILHYLNVDFSIAFEQENNSGCDIRRLGEEGLFEELMENNLELFSNIKPRKIVTTDPHSYNAFKNDYSELNIQILHSTELLYELMKQDVLIKNKLGFVFTYHDPCYLGRYNNLYDIPRKLLECIGVKLIELPRYRRNSFCCGGGGGGIWVSETNSSDRLNIIRAKEIANLGVEGVATSCPKCLVMLEDAFKSINPRKEIIVKDVIELIAQALELD